MTKMDEKRKMQTSLDIPTVYVEDITFGVDAP